jgi:hypothetical protein
MIFEKFALVAGYSRGMPELKSAHPRRTILIRNLDEGWVEATIAEPPFHTSLRFPYDFIVNHPEIAVADLDTALNQYILERKQKPRRTASVTGVSGTPGGFAGIFYEDDTDKWRVFFTHAGDARQAQIEWEEGMPLEEFKAKYDAP